VHSYPQEVFGDICQPRNVKEAISREQSLRAMTINVARQWHQANIIATIVDGEEVFKAS
jgi:hypothetical protein